MLTVIYKGWLGNLDSNQDKQSQSLLCYRYTIPQESEKNATTCFRNGYRRRGSPFPMRSF